MICDKCQQRTASVHVTQIHNNEKREIHLCEQCAKENEQLTFTNPIAFTSPFDINNLLAGFLGSDFAYKTKSQGKTSIPKCSVCGMAYDQFVRSGKLGCANCYELFKGTVEPTLKRIHGHVQHSGKLPNRAGGTIKVKRDLEKLKTQLARVVQAEEYEEAAKLRDQIRELESALEGDQ